MTTEFNNWLSGFTAVGGCNLTAGFSATPVAPDACRGGTTSVTYTVVSSCYDKQTCKAAFVVAAASPVVYTCNVDTTAGACQTQDQVNTEFNNWLSAFTASGGCNLSAGFGKQPVAPDACKGRCYYGCIYCKQPCEDTHTCSATFTVTAATPVVYTCNVDTTAGACQTQDQVNTEFNNWLAVPYCFRGCNLSVGFGKQPVAPDACKGGATTVVYTVNSSCEDTHTCSATFTVTAATPVVYTCNVDTTAGACQTQDQVNTEFNNWLSAFISYRRL